MKTYEMTKYDPRCNAWDKTRYDAWDKSRYGARVGEVLDCLPRALVRELCGVMRGCDSMLCELRLRAHGVSSVVLGAREFPLYYRIGADGLSGVLMAVCGGSLYAHRDGISSGSLSLPSGVRIAVAGEARYDGGTLVGVDGISSILFRIPGGVCNFAAELADGWRKCGCRNMLVCAPPMGGKTTALRALAGIIGSGFGSRRVVVVDERGEFDPTDYPTARVDILRGYRRGTGTVLAVRTMSPGVIIVDEIASVSDAEAVRLAVGVGVPVIASVHAATRGDLFARDFVAGLVRDGSFPLATVISREGGRFTATAPTPVAV